MKFRGHLRKQHGASLVGVLVALGVLGVFTSAFANALTGMYRHMKHLEQKGDLLALKNQMIAVLQNPSICQCHLNPSYAFTNGANSNLKFDSTLTDGSQKITMNRLQSGCLSDSPRLAQVGSKLSSGLEVQEISLNRLRPTGVPNEWQGEWTVALNPQSLAGPLKNISVIQRFVVQTNGSGATPTQARVDSCVGGPTEVLDCQTLGGTPDPGTGKCNFYMGQMARAIYRLNASSGNISVNIKSGPADGVAVQGVGCAPGSDSLYSTGPCTSADGEPDPVTSVKEIFIYRNDYAMVGTTKKFDSIHCNEAHGWQLVGCFQAVDGDDSDIVYAANGCATGDFRQGKSTELTITCVKHLW